VRDIVAEIQQKIARFDSGPRRSGGAWSHAAQGSVAAMHRTSAATFA